MLLLSLPPDSLFASFLVLEEALMLHELLGKHELLRLVEGALARRGVEVVRRLVVRSTFHRLRSQRVYFRRNMVLGNMVRLSIGNVLDITLIGDRRSRYIDTF